MSFFWWVSEIRKNANHADVLWALMIGMSGLWFVSDWGWNRATLVGLLIAIWSLRLAGFLFWTRVLRESLEDGRYRSLREKWGPKASRRFWFVFQFQWILAILFWLALLPAFLSPQSFPEWFDWVGLSIWGISIFGELLADRQLQEWKQNPANRGKTCRLGLWRYSRHPNYFFEWMHWSSYVFFAWASDLWWLSLWGPLLMYIFLMKITGIPATERQARKSRSDYEEYQQTTNMFFPWFPKKGRFSSL